jgi:serine/threonine protein kinase
MSLDDELGKAAIAAVRGNTAELAQTTTAAVTPPPVTGLYGEVFSKGAVIGPYVVEALAGQGGFASLYRARHADTGQIVAVKVLRHALAGSMRMIERFQREAEALGRLAHPHIVQILESGDLTDGRPYIAMEWLDGRDLGQKLAARGPFEAREALAVMSEIGAALAAAHAAGVVHRDVKAPNVIAIPRGHGSRSSWSTPALPG